MAVKGRQFFLCVREGEGGGPRLALYLHLGHSSIESSVIFWPANKQYNGRRRYVNLSTDGASVVYGAGVVRALNRPRACVR